MNRLFIPKPIFDDMLAHCKMGLPNEACGILAGSGNEVSKIYKMTNIENSPVSYFMDSKEQFKIMKELREKDISLLAIFHSHTSSAAYPSQKDVSLAFYEDAVYINVSFAGMAPVVNGFSIQERDVKEVEISVSS